MSAIRGVNDGHMWKHVGTANVGSNFWLKCSQYTCAYCGVKFNHRYDMVPNIERAMRMEAVPEQCEKSVCQETNM